LGLVSKTEQYFMFFCFTVNFGNGAPTPSYRGLLVQQKLRLVIVFTGNKVVQFNHYFLKMIYGGSEIRSNLKSCIQTPSRLIKIVIPRKIKDLVKQSFICYEHEYGEIN